MRVELGAVRKSRRGGGSDWAVVLSLNGVLAGLLALVVSVGGEFLTVETELAYFSSQAGRKALVYF